MVVPLFPLLLTTSWDLKLWDLEGEIRGGVWLINTPFLRRQATVVFMEGKKTRDSSGESLGCWGLFYDAQVPGHLECFSEVLRNELSKSLLDDATDVCRTCGVDKKLPVKLRGFWRRDEVAPCRWVLTRCLQ